MIIRQSAFGGNNKLLKGALHCHTTRSDGKLTPEEALRRYSSLGYDFAALTDHRIYNYKNYAPETGITVIPGMEFDGTFEGVMKAWGPFRCFHIVTVGPDDETNGFKQDESFPAADDANGQEDFQRYLDWLHEKGNLTVYCHPEWSGTSARYFDKLEGNFAMEVWNTTSKYMFDMDSNASYWDELLGMDKKLYGVAADDCHIAEYYGKGWVMVNAENNVKAILNALKNGDFYASCGPRILDFYVEDGIAHIKTEPCARIQFIADMFPNPVIEPENGGEMTEASLDLNGEYKYIRACVTDKEGNRAWTNPIFLDKEIYGE